MLPTWSMEWCEMEAFDERSTDKLFLLLFFLENFVGNFSDLLCIVLNL